MNDLELIKHARDMVRKYNVCEIQMNMMILDIKQGRLRNKEEISARAKRFTRRARNA